MNNEEEIIILSDWKVGISRSKDGWTILLAFEGVKDDGGNRKHQWDIKSSNKINNRSIDVVAVPKGNWRDERMSLEIDDIKICVKVFDEGLVVYENVYQCRNLLEPTVIFELIQRFKNEIEILNHRC